MEIEKYEPEKHGEDVADSFSGAVSPASSIQKYREVVEEAIEDVEDVFGIEAEFRIVIAEVDIESLEQEFGEDIPPNAYFRGYSLGSAVHDHAEENIVFLATNDEYEWWRPGLKHLFVHEEAHQEFYAVRPGMEHVIWESIIFEGHAGYRAEKVNEEKNYSWKGLSEVFSFNGDPPEVKKELDKKREWEGERYERENSSGFFSFGGDKWENAEGYIASIEVYRDILERNDMDVDEPLSKSESWLKEEIKKSLDSLYG